MKGTPPQDVWGKYSESLVDAMRAHAITPEEVCRAYYREHGRWPDVSDIDAETHKRLKTSTGGSNPRPTQKTAEAGKCEAVGVNHQYVSDAKKLKEDSRTRARKGVSKN